MKRAEYVNANRAAWDEAASFHEMSQSFAELMNGFGQPGYSCLDAVETEWLEQIGLDGKSVAQLCCNNGREILSIENMGAATCVGFDVSGEFLAHARQFSDAGKLTCQFVQTDIYELPPEFDHQFDLCVVTIGVFGWMPDLGRFLDTVNRLLKPGGKLFVHEEHPIMNMFDPKEADPFKLVESYFRDEPFEETQVIVYDGEDKGTGSTHYWFVHTLSDVITGCLEIGLRIEAFREYADNISSEEFNVYEEAELPLSYVLVAAKPD